MIYISIMWVWEGMFHQSALLSVHLVQFTFWATEYTVYLLAVINIIYVNIVNGGVV